MTFRPFAIARWGVYVAVGAAVLSAWWGYNAGNALDASLMRSVFVFVLFSALAFGAEAVLITGPIVQRPAPTTQPPAAEAENETDETEDE